MMRFVCLLGALLFAVPVSAQPTSTYDQWYAHCLTGQLRILPATPKVINPLHTATQVPLSTVLTFDSLCAVTVEWYFGTSSVPPRIVGPTGFTYAPTLLPNTQYFWKVVVRNGYSSSTSPTWNFRTVTTATASTVTVAPLAGTVLVGATTTLTATVKDTAGQSMPGATVLWGSNPTGVVSLAANGQSVIVTGVSAGTATVTATSGAVTGSATVTVATNQTLTAVATFDGFPRDVVGRSEAGGADGQNDAQFSVTISSAVTIAKVVLQTVSSTGGNGAWDTVSGNGTWLLGVAAFATGPLIPLPVTGANLVLAAADGGSPEYFLPGTVLSIVGTTSDGRTFTALVTIPSGGGPPPCADPCALDPVGISFTASLDHAEVTSYRFEAMAPGEATIGKDLGKPTPDTVAGCAAPSPCIAVTLPELKTLTMNVLYAATVTATTPTGSVVSFLSNTFMRTK